MLNYNGMQIVIDDKVLASTSEFLFPPSRHRSRRIHKKLVKRFGGEVRMKPACWKIGDKLYIHSTIWSELQKHVHRSPIISYECLQEMPRVYWSAAQDITR